MTVAGFGGVLQWLPDISAPPSTLPATDTGAGASTNGNSDPASDPRVDREEADEEAALPDVQVILGPRHSYAWLTCRPLSSFSQFIH